MQVPLQETSLEIWDKKYRLKDHNGVPVDSTVESTYHRVAEALASCEREEVREHHTKRFKWALDNGAIPAGRIMSNAGASVYKPYTSLINCTVSSIIDDSMEGIMDGLKEAAMTLKAGCGIGYEFSTLRPKGAFVVGAGATTSGSLTFMDVFDKMCFTVSSAGGRRGAQMGTMAVWHPDVKDFISAKREDGRLRQFNLSLLIDDEFVEAVKSKAKYQLVFPVTAKEEELGLDGTVVWKKIPWEQDYCEKKGYTLDKEAGLIKCKVYETVGAEDLWDTIMQSTYDYAEPGFLLIDEINRMNNNQFCETVRATNP